MFKKCMITLSYGLAALTLLSLSNHLKADVSDYSLSFGPYIGGGTQSNGAEVRHSSGFKASLDRRFPLGAGFNAGPIVQIGNGLVSSKYYSHRNKILSTYDNRFFTCGIKLGKVLGNEDLSNELFIAVLTGFAQSKLEEEESTDNTYVEKQYRNIKGQYSVVEIGTKIQVRRNFSLDIAFLGHLYRANQRKANANIDGSMSDENGSHSLAGDPERKKQFDHLDSEMVQKSLAATLGISLGF